MAKRILSASEQVAECLRQELARGRWTHTLPGIHRLATELDLPRKQIERALPLLEKEGLLIPQGPGRKRLIAALDLPGKRPLRVAVIDFDPQAKQETLTVTLLHRLSEQGHTAILCDKTLEELGMDPARIGKLVHRTRADAWILRAAHRPVLEWFLRHKIPVFSVYGNFINLPVAAVGLRYLPTLQIAIRQLVRLGHRSIAILGSHGQAVLKPGNIWDSLLKELASHGLPASQQHMPQWEDNREGFNRMLASLFEHVRPSGLIIEEENHLIAAFQFCAHHGIRVPQQVSLICMQPGTQFEYCLLPPTHIAWDTRPITKVIGRWLRNVARGKTDTHQHFFSPQLVAGKTIGPAPVG